MIYEKPGSDGALFTFRQRYENFVGGEWVAPADGVYFDNPSPVDGKPFCEVARSSQADLEKALDAAHAAAPGWGKTAAAERANILLKMISRYAEDRYQSFVEVESELFEIVRRLKMEQGSG